MNKLAHTIRVLDHVSELLGKTFAYFAVLLVLITCYVVITRYVFNTGSIAIQESVLYVNALLVFFTAGFTLKHNAHVRVDIIYGPASAKYKAWVNLLGAAFLLLPVSVFIFLSCWDYVMSSWAIREDSPEANGLPFVYLLKTSILAMCVILIVQGLTELLRNLHFLLDPASTAVEMEDEDLGTL